MKKELQDLMKLAGTPAFDKELKKLHAKYKGNASAKQELGVLLQQHIAAANKTIDVAEKEIDMKMQLKDVSEIVSLSYIADKYFNKTRQWLYQRINGNLVNGKASKFTDDELNKFQYALKDISKKIGSVSIRR
jgi:hypothetical protein